jgi:hypothetical protein
MMPQVAAPTSSIWRREAYTDGAEQASNAPDLASLANKWGLATKYWAGTHPFDRQLRGKTDLP